MKRRISPFAFIGFSLTAGCASLLPPYAGCRRSRATAFGHSLLIERTPLTEAHPVVCHSATSRTMQLGYGQLSPAGIVKRVIGIEPLV